jgi:hypothetical protein
LQSHFSQYHEEYERVDKIEESNTSKECFNYSETSDSKDEHIFVEPTILKQVLITDCIFLDESNEFENEDAFVKNAPDGGAIFCRKCSWIFNTKEDLQTHFKQTHENDVRVRTSEQSTTSYFNCTKTSFQYSKEEQEFNERTRLEEVQITGTKVAGKWIQEFKRFVKSETKWECLLCGYKAIQSRVNIHYKAVHQGIKDFQCELCGNYFSRKDNLTQHLRILHKQIK